MCGSAASEVQCIYQCIIDQSNWSGPFSLVFMTLDWEFRSRGFESVSRPSTDILALHLFHIYVDSCLLGARSSLIGRVVRGEAVCEVTVPVLGESMSDGTEFPSFGPIVCVSGVLIH